MLLLLLLLLLLSLLLSSSLFLLLLLDNYQFSKLNNTRGPGQAGLRFRKGLNKPTSHVGDIFLAQNLSEMNIYSILNPVLNK